jgi:hypothetical protein
MDLFENTATGIHSLDNTIFLKRGFLETAGKYGRSID